MDKENIEILKKIKKIFKEKGGDPEDLEILTEVNAKKKLHKYRKITDVKDMKNQSASRIGAISLCGPRRWKPE